MKSPSLLSTILAVAVSSAWGAGSFGAPSVTNGFNPASGKIAAAITQPLAGRMAHWVWTAVDRGDLKFDEGAVPVLENLEAGNEVSDDDRVFLRAYLEAALEKDETLGEVFRKNLDVEGETEQEAAEKRMLLDFMRGGHVDRLIRALGDSSVQEAAAQKVGFWISEAVEAMRVQDIDGDAENEILVMSTLARQAFPSSTVVERSDTALSELVGGVAIDLPEMLTDARGFDGGPGAGLLGDKPDQN